MFDRYLLPGSYKRQAFVLLDANREPLGGQATQVIYDPVALTITITGPEGYGTRWLTPGQTYYLVLTVADDARDAVEDLSGFRSIDREPLAERRDYIFRAGLPASAIDAGSADAGADDAGTDDAGTDDAGTDDAGRTDEDPGDAGAEARPNVGRRLDPVVDFCADVLPIFAKKCGNAICHGAKGMASGLILDSAAGIDQTAVNRVAHGSNTGRQDQTAESVTRPFGVDMPIITPGDPGASWLIYKIELAAEMNLPNLSVPNVVCTPPAGSPPIPTRSNARTAFVDDAIAQAVMDGFRTRDRSSLARHVTGREMPYPYPAAAYLEEGAWAYTPLTFEERERLRIWIADRAPTYECGGCGIVEKD